VRLPPQISQHNHRISDEIYNCYSNNSSVPDELLLGAQVEGEPQPIASTSNRNFEGEETGRVQLIEAVDRNWCRCSLLFERSWRRNERLRHAGADDIGAGGGYGRRYR
jgi:hypothetical protein